MNDLILAAILFGVTLLILASSMWVALTVALVAILGFIVTGGDADLLMFVPYNAADSFVLTAIPLFIFMGEILVKCQVSDSLYKGVSKWLAWAPGGLLHSNIGASALFAGISGSSVATAATIGTVAAPELKRRGYDSKLILGSLAAGGSLGILIPPSTTMIIYGMLASKSVGKLFAGGIFPGIIMSTLFIAYIGIRVILDPTLAPKEKNFSIKSVISSLGDMGPVLILMLIVLGGIFGGLVTPTEAAAIGASLALIIAMISKKLTWRSLKESMLSSLETTCMVMFLIVAAFMFSTLLSILRIPETLVVVVKDMNLSPIVVLLLVYALYLFLGCFIDVTSSLVMTYAAVLPLVGSLGYDLIWFGVVFVILVEVGLLTPPMGINLFVIQGVSGQPLQVVVRGAWPFFIIQLLCVTLFTIFPSIVLWLPNKLFGN